MNITLILFTTIILGFLFNINNLDFNVPYNLILIELHNHTLYYLVMILFAKGWILFSLIYNYIINKWNKPYIYLNHGTLIEFIWAIIPAVILILIAFPSFKLLYLMDEVSDPSISVLVEGHQWYWSYQSTDFLGSTDELIEFDSYLVPESDLIFKKPINLIRQMFGTFDIIVNPSKYIEIKSQFKDSKKIFIKPLIEKHSEIFNEINKMTMEKNMDIYQDMARITDWDSNYWYQDEWSTIPRLSENLLNNLKETETELIQNTTRDAKSLMWWDLEGSYRELQELANQLKLYPRGNRRNIEMYDIITEYLRTPNNVLKRYEENMELTREIGNLLRNQEQLN